MGNLVRYLISNGNDEMLESRARIGMRFIFNEAPCIETLFDMQSEFWLVGLVSNSLSLTHMSIVQIHRLYISMTCPTVGSVFRLFLIKRPLVHGTFGRRQVTIMRFLTLILIAC
jgi:hypothetical protein